MAKKLFSLLQKAMKPGRKPTSKLKTAKKHKETPVPNRCSDIVGTCRIGVDLQKRPKQPSTKTLKTNP